MKKIIALLFLASCQATTHQAAYVNVGESEFLDNEISDFEAIPTVEVGFMFGGEAEAEDRIVGAVGDLAVRVSNGRDTYDAPEWIPGMESIDIIVETAAARGGVRYYFDTGTPWLQPYLGGGFIFQQTWLSTNIMGDSADAFRAGGYGVVGVDSQIGDHLRIGVGYTMTAGMHPSMDGESYDLDTGMLLAGIGWSF